MSIHWQCVACGERKDMQSYYERSLCQCGGEIEEVNLQAALDLLGKWLVAKNFRSHCIYGGDNEWTVELFQNHGYKNEVTTKAYKPTKAEAIIEALKNAK